MSLIHEKLYRQQHFKGELYRLPDDLVSSLSYSYNIERSEIEFKISTEQVFLNMDLAVSLGLCVQNSFQTALSMPSPITEKAKSDWI